MYLLQWDVVLVEKSLLDVDEICDWNNHRIHFDVKTVEDSLIILIYKTQNLLVVYFGSLELAKCG